MKTHQYHRAPTDWRCDCGNVPLTHICADFGRPLYFIACTNQNCSNFHRVLVLDPPREASVGNEILAEFCIPTFPKNSIGWTGFKYEGKAVVSES